VGGSGEVSGLGGLERVDIAPDLVLNGCSRLDTVDFMEWAGPKQES
jgi:hypothetical protein